jgi:hypothetical protein
MSVDKTFGRHFKARFSDSSPTLRIPRQSKPTEPTPPPLVTPPQPAEIRRFPAARRFFEIKLQKAVDGIGSPPYMPLHRTGSAGFRGSVANMTGH